MDQCCNYVPKVRFDYLTMQTEWRDYLETEGGYVTPDVPLIAALVAEHSKVFRELLAPYHVVWFDLEGDFGMPEDCVPDDRTIPLRHEEIDLMWSDAFTLVDDKFDEIDALVHKDWA